MRDDRHEIGLLGSLTIMFDIGENFERGMRGMNSFKRIFPRSLLSLFFFFSVSSWEKIQLKLLSDKFALEETWNVLICSLY